MTTLQADFTAVSEEQENQFSALNHTLTAMTLIKHQFAKELDQFLTRCGIANNADGSNPLVLAACSAPSPSVDILAVLARHNYSFENAPLNVKSALFQSFSAQYPQEAARARIHLPSKLPGGHGWG